MGREASFVNRLLGERAQAVAEVRADGRGTRRSRGGSSPFRAQGSSSTRRRCARSGSPGDAREGLAAAFDDIAALAAGYRFRDGRHEKEPGCAVLAAIALRRIDPARAESYRALFREAAHEARRRDRGLQIAKKRAARRTARAIRDFYRDR